jgi:hypothetical protein
MKTAHFCDKSGVRIVAPPADHQPGVPRFCKAVDPEHGAEEFSEQPAPVAKGKAATEKPAEGKKAE